MAMTINIQEQEHEFSFTEHDFNVLAEMVHTQAGIVMPLSKKNMLYSRLSRRVRALNLNNFAEYCELLQSPAGAAENKHFVNSVTTNLTHFFRESHHFDDLEQNVLAPLLAHSPAVKRLRIWSAGCSNGMEPYTIAMLVHKLFAHRRDWDVRILATDIDTGMLQEGSKGEYAEEELENIPAAYREHVARIDNSKRIAISQKLKNLVAFKPLNLLKPLPMKGPFDAIFCRNVVIYFDKPTQKELFNRIAPMLKPTGRLYIGHSENLSNVCSKFKHIGRTIYQRIE
jgi:chemotaxis protein methyltransferase CheR